ncbi:MAG: hypothetical protein LW817_02310 [Candidatus Caenarcaniphilales bacterium]|nr:hypothetical protein [Candidatus Caenarcaniphilales bacterium]
MKQIFNTIVACSLALGTVLSANASSVMIRPINIQNAYIDTENKNELRVEFSWLHDNFDFGGLSFSQDRYTVPQATYRRSFETEIPTRVSVGLGLAVNSTDISVFGEGSDLDFGNVYLGLEAALINSEEHSLTLYFDQNLPSGGFNVGTPGVLNNASFDNYSFQTGLRHQIALGDLGTIFTDLAYAKSMSLDDNLEISFDYFSYGTEFVANTPCKVKPSIGFMGQHLFNDVDADSMYLVPGLIVALDDDAKYQARIGVPIGLSGDDGSDFDIGIQAGLFASI